MVTLKHVTIGF